MTVVDRTAFASCMFLNDTKLQQYLEDLTTSLIEAGNLNGILLTGTPLFWTLYVQLLMQSLVLDRSS